MNSKIIYETVNNAVLSTTIDRNPNRLTLPELQRVNRRKYNI